MPTILPLDECNSTFDCAKVNQVCNTKDRRCECVTESVWDGYQCVGKLFSNNESLSLSSHGH